MATCCPGSAIRFKIFKMFPDVTPAVRADLAPTGKLRAGINYGNFVLAAKDPETGEPRGIAPELAREIAARLDVSVEFVSFETAGRMADAVKTGAWDIAFLANEPERASEILFTPPYLEIEAGYLVPPGSPIQDVAEVDSPGIRIGIATKSAYDLFLTRALRHAMLFERPGWRVRTSVRQRQTRCARGNKAMAGHDG